MAQTQQAELREMQDQAVLDGNKTMTRRAVGNHMTNDDIKAYLKGFKDVAYNLAPYKIVSNYLIGLKVVIGIQ